MFKLLTDNARIKVKKEYFLRRLIVGIGGICIIFLMGIIALLPSYIISKARMNEANIKIQALNNKASIKEAHALVVGMDELSQEIASLSPATGSTLPYELFLKIVNSKPTGITINSFVLKKDLKSIVISVSGVANGRKNLSDFENILNNSGNFSEVKIPVSNFAKNSDINFQFNLSPK